MCGATPCPQPLGTLPSSIIANRCYANGVTAVEVMDTSSPDIVTTVKKSGTQCYSYVTQSSGEIVLKNPAGATVVTSVIDSVSGTASITCAGSSAVTVSLACLSSAANGIEPTCTTGTCAP
jgi:hypothetical protein